jgi:hypothetical protein
MYMCKIEALSKAQTTAVEGIASRLGVNPAGLLEWVRSGGISFSDLTWRAYADSDERMQLTNEFLGAQAA